MTPAERQRLLAQFRAAINASPLTPYEIAKQSGVDRAALSRFLGGGALSVESLERLAPVLGLHIIVKEKPRKKK